MRRPRAVRQPRLDWPPERRRRAATPPRARSHRLGVRADPGVARARAERLRARGLLGALVGALRLQAFGASAAAAAVERRARVAGAGRERGGGRHRRRPRGRVQGRVAQPSERSGAVPGCGDRRRRHPPRCRRHGSAADRSARRALVRRSRLALPSRGRRDRAVRELPSGCRPWAGRRSSTMPTPRTRS